jgi:RNA polymerase sigma-70 factor, ECF subfamily
VGKNSKRRADPPEAPGERRARAHGEVPNGGERELVRGALAGDPEACRDLVERHQGALYRLLLRLVRDPALAEDLAQEAFVKAFRSLASFDPARRFSSWLLKIGHNTALDHLRRRRVPTVPLAGEDEGHHRAPLAKLADPGIANPEERARGVDLARELTAVVAGLEPGYRELVLLRYQEELSYQEIVELTGLPLGTVKVRLHRARALLAKGLAERGWGEAR